MDEAILVRGSTRISRIKIILKNYFPGVTVNDRINPDEVVAYGATMEAAKLMDKDEQILDKVILKDVTPLTLGMIT